MPATIKRRRDGWPAVSPEAHQRADEIYEQLRASPKSLRYQIIDELHDLAGDEVMDEQIKPIEQHGFTIVDCAPDKMTLRLFKWDVRTQPVEAIDALEPFYTTELVRPA